jgi:ABC-2 type transport system permease protein
MSSKKVLQIFKIEFRLFLREPAAVFFTFAFPGVWIAFFGILYEEPLGGGPLSNVHYMLPGAIGLVIVATAFMGLTAILVEYKELGIFRRYRITPLGFPALMLGFILSNLVSAAVGIVVVFMVAIFGFNVPLKYLGPISHLILVILLGLFTFFSLSFAIASLIKSARSASAVTTMIFMPMIFLSEFFIPINQMPQWLQPIAKVLPLTPLNQILREIICFGGTILGSTLELVILLGWLGFALVISVFFFKWE